MYPDHERHHSSVPVSTFDLSVVFCHQCQAWRLIRFGVAEDEFGYPRAVDVVEQDFGPFDDRASVLEAIRAQLSEHLLPPFGSWFPASVTTTVSLSPPPSSDSDQPTLW